METVIFRGSQKLQTWMKPYIVCRVGRGQGQRLGPMALFPAQGQAQGEGQCSPTGWPVAWGRGWALALGLGEAD